MMETFWSAVHAFPYTRECAYLNTAATGLAWPGAAAAADNFYGGVLSCGFDRQEEWQSVARQAAFSVASILGAPDLKVDFFSSTTHAFNLVAHSIALESEDEIVLAADEHPSVCEPWLNSPQCAHRVRVVDVQDESSREALLLAAITPRTRVLAVSHVHSRTGTRLDLQTLAAECRAKGALLIVDGIQAVGAVPVDAKGVDVYCAATFKWLLAGFGLAFIATSAEARSRLLPAFRGYRNLPPSTSLQYSHLNYPALYVLLDSLERFAQFSSEIYGRVEELASRLKEAMLGLGHTIITPLDPVRSAGIVALSMPDVARAETVRSMLASRRISVAARGNVIRVSPHFYNSEHDIQVLTNAWADIVCPE
ncbi:aminotransferase class V-fold PLP-dependent enzyme [Paraburkholderia xenovorans]